MSRTIQLNEIQLSTKSKPVTVVVDKITAVRPYQRVGNPPRSKDRASWRVRSARDPDVRRS